MMRKSLVLLLLVCFLTAILSAQEDTKAPEATTQAPETTTKPAEASPKAPEATTNAPEASTKASGRIEAAGTVLDEIQGAPD